MSRYTLILTDTDNGIQVEQLTESANNDDVSKSLTCDMGEILHHNLIEFLKEHAKERRAH